MTENYENNYTEQTQEIKTTKPSWADGNSEILKFLTIALSSFLGTFMALILLGKALLTPTHLIPPHPHHIKHMKNNHYQETNIFDDEELFKDINKDFELMTPKMFAPITTPKFHIVNIEENNDNYKITIDLKQFHDDEKNVMVDVKPNYVKISGKASVKTEKEQSSFSYFQEIPLTKKIELEDIKKEKIGNNYIITIPFED